MKGRICISDERSGRVHRTAALSIGGLAEVAMLSPPEQIGALRLSPTTTREVRGVVIRLIIAVALILLIGALSCSVALGRRTNKRERLDLQERFEAEQCLGPRVLGWNS
jgi:hypothetical protein